MKRHAITQVGSLALAVGIAMGIGLGAVQVAGAQPASPTDPVSVVLAFEKNIGNDVEGGLALFADDATLSVTPPPQGMPPVWTGKDALRQALQGSKDHLVKREVVGTPSVNGNKVTYTVMASNDFFQQIGVAPVQFSTEAVVEGGKIKSFVTALAPSEQGRVGAAIQAYAATHDGAPAAQGAQGPAGMPRTGGAQTGGGEMPVLLMIFALCLIAAGASVQLKRTRSR